MNKSLMFFRKKKKGIYLMAPTATTISIRDSQVKKQRNSVDPGTTKVEVTTIEEKHALPAAVSANGPASGKKE